jgi:hypothetical protein
MHLILANAYPAERQPSNKPDQLQMYGAELNKTNKSLENEKMVPVCNMKLRILRHGY